jgi:putative hydrolase of the HAD superfamily
MVAVVGGDAVAGGGLAEGIGGVGAGGGVGQGGEDGGLVIEEAAGGGVGYRQVAQREASGAAGVDGRGEVIFGEVPIGACGEDHRQLDGTTLRLCGYNRREMSEIRAVLFDYGLVLSGPPDPAAWLEMQRLLGVDEATLQKAYWLHRDAYDRGALSGVAYWAAVAREFKRPLDVAGLDGLIEADTALWTRPNVVMIEWATRLQRAGIKTGILSNLGDAMEVGIRARFPWLERFHHHTFSHRLGIAKPDAAIYRHAAEGLETAMEEILFVDDKVENIEAARAAGMVAMLYASHAGFVEGMKAAGLGWMLEV